MCCNLVVGAVAVVIAAAVVTDAVVADVAKQSFCCCEQQLTQAQFFEQVLCYAERIRRDNVYC